MEKIISIPPTKNIDHLLDDYNRMKKFYEETNEEEYKNKMELYIGIMKAMTTPLTMKVGTDMPYTDF